MDVRESGLSSTPRGNRIHIAFFGLRNAGKSTLVNAFTGQDIAIVSDVAGTTTDPVSKAMEILPLGPCLITDTAGLDDVGELGRQRVEKSLKVLETTDIAVWVEGGDRFSTDEDVRCPSESTSQPLNLSTFIEKCRQRNVKVFVYHRGDSVEELKAKIASVKLEDETPALLEGLVKKGDRIVCVVPIDESAPKGRLILPQQQVIRECLDRGAICTICQPEQLERALGYAPSLVITDSQVFGKVKRQVEGGRRVRLTSFSVLFARQKGDLALFVQGLEQIRRLKDGDTVLIAEACTHHRQCNDIGTVKMPKALEKLSGRKLKFEFASGKDFLQSAVGLNWDNGRPRPLNTNHQPPISLIVHCGGCMLTRREMMRRIECARAAGVPIVNYGLVLAAANGLEIGDILV